MFNYGIYPTMITPYKQNGEIDFAKAEDYVEWYFKKGCAGIFAVCQSSEIHYLSVDERVELNKVVFRKAKELEKKYGRKMTIVSSGHVADSIEEQAYELNRIVESGTDALILITNRLDQYNEGDDVFIRNAEKLLKLLPENVALGLYECPNPYKRLVTPRILEWCLSVGRFRFMKDTCCNAELIRERLQQLEGTEFKLLNANCQTLLSSLRNGGAGYCGIMANYHPELYVWLYENYKKNPQKAEELQSVIGTAGFTEVGLPYPLTAKYHMCLEGLVTENIARNRKSEELTEYSKDCTYQMRTLCKLAYENICKV